MADPLTRSVKQSAFGDLPDEVPAGTPLVVWCDMPSEPPSDQLIVIFYIDEVDHMLVETLEDQATELGRGWPSRLPRTCSTWMAAKNATARRSTATSGRASER